MAGVQRNGESQRYRGPMAPFFPLYLWLFSVPLYPNLSFPSLTMTWMMRRAALVAALVVSVPAAAQDSAQVATVDSTWQEHAQAGEAARAAGDWGGWRYHLVRVREEIGYHPSIVFNLARADARLGRTEDALAWLQAFAATGLVRDVANDSAFAQMRQGEAWTALVERIAANARPVANAQPAFTLPDSAFMPEG